LAPNNAVWSGVPMGPPPAMAANSAANPTAFLPVAREMPHNGLVGGAPSHYPGFETTFDGDHGGGGEAYPEGMGNPQVHTPAGGPDRFWIDVEHLAWKVRSMPIPFPLAVASPPASSGLLGQEGTRVLFGDENVKYGAYFNVLRLTGGSWDCDRIWGVELSGFIQEARSEVADFHEPITGREVLARPLIDALTGQVSAVLVGFPGQFAGDIFINSRLKLGGAEANIVRS